jgi:hypothetical protein
MPIRCFKRAETAANPRISYRRAIVAVLCLKAVGLALLYILFFAPIDRPTITESVVARHLLTPPEAATGDEVNHDR